MGKSGLSPAGINSKKEAKTGLLRKSENSRAFGRLAVHKRAEVFKRGKVVFHKQTAVSIAGRKQDHIEDKLSGHVQPIFAACIISGRNSARDSQVAAIMVDILKPGLQGVAVETADCCCFPRFDAWIDPLVHGCGAVCVNVFDGGHITGHVLKAVAYYLIFKGALETELLQPYYQMLRLNKCSVRQKTWPSFKTSS